MLKKAQRHVSCVQTLLSSHTERVNNIQNSGCKFTLSRLKSLRISVQFSWYFFNGRFLNNFVLEIYISIYKEHLKQQRNLFQKESWDIFWVMTYISQAKKLCNRSLTDISKTSRNILQHYQMWFENIHSSINKVRKNIKPKIPWKHMVKHMVNITIENI